eukprot:TRINITY_DN20386_c0_g1_i2.p2 TRINITY_DN20386_c0_g1~~TRINITY_DN20386_c0_g1_i2.p2  ORF type:complete len:250 (+),score=21.47 TRINITY_DN20386_c0_g1_i2:214-963(+)
MWAVNASQCQERCRAQATCAFFSYWPAVQGCLLQNGSAVPVHDPNVTAGPRECPPAPAGLPEPTDRELSLGGSSQSWGDWLKTRPDLLALAGAICMVPAVLLCVFALWAQQKQARRRGPNSRPGEPDYHAVATSTDYAVMYEHNGQTDRSLEMSSHRSPLAAHSGAALAEQGEVPSWTAQCAESSAGSSGPLHSDRYASAQLSGRAPDSPFLHPEDLGIHSHLPQASQHVPHPQTSHMPWPYPSSGHPQ